MASAPHAVSLADSSVRGTTGPTLILHGACEEGTDLATPALTRSEPANPHAQHFELADRDSGWTLVDAETFLVYLPVGEACAIKFDPLAGSLGVLAPPERVIDLAWQAIDRAPDWFSTELRDAFSRMDTTHQEIFAQVILSTVDPFVDEVAFVIAHTAPEVLQAAGFYPQLLTENAEDVYAHDAFLDYVDIVDCGSAAGGGDYYSTVRYRTAATRDTAEVELPRERYYWDIVHPKITDEFPTYIDPADGSAEDPPVGRFWREFLFTHSDSGYPLLKDQLSGCLTLWEGGVDTKINGAVGILTQWIQDVMEFGSGVERPIQPVRIYHKHLGRCGEHADITAAAARAALIATNSPQAIASDHTWNEFYDRRWVHWEPVNTYVDSPWHYEGWGKVFLGIFNWRGDDWTWTVTHRYTPHCTLTVAVTDSFGYPVDGAQVTIAKKLAPMSFQESTWASTDHNGLCQFLLGDEIDIYGRVDSPLGTNPPGPLYKPAVLGSVAGGHYSWTRMVPDPRPQLPVQPAALPPLRDEEYRIRILWEAASEFCYGQNRIGHRTFSDHLPGGSVEFFICDESNYGSYASGDSFFAYEIRQDAPSAEVTFTLPTGGDWYAVLSNEEHVVNSQVVRGTAEIYSRQVTALAEGETREDLRVRWGGNLPNPFSPRTWIAFSLGSETRVTVSVYDVTGRLVTTLLSGTLTAGEHRVPWEGMDSQGQRVAAGVYLCLLETPEERVCRKMVLVQ